MNTINGVPSPPCYSDHTQPPAHTGLDTVRVDEVLDQYRACRDELTDRQWQAVCLRFGHGLSQQQIASHLHRSQSSISALLQRAKERKDAYCRRLRMEQHELMRRHMDDPE